MNTTNGMPTESQSSNGASRARPEPVDRDPSSRPGVPMIGKVSGTVSGKVSGKVMGTPGGEPTAAGTSGGAIPQQQSDVEVLVGVEVGRLTPIFGTTSPPRGLSGFIRRRAYRIPEHKAARWMLLMLGDRVDIQESRLRRHPFLGAGLLAGLIAATVGGRQRRARRGWLAALTCS